MPEETATFSGELKLAELYDESDEWLGLAVLVGEDDLLGTLSDLDGRQVRITVEVLDSGSDEADDGAG